MLSLQKPQPIQAYLKTQITYIKDGKEITIEPETSILVDIKENIALIQNDHVEIFPDEYQLNA